MLIVGISWRYIEARVFFNLRRYGGRGLRAFIENRLFTFLRLNASILRHACVSALARRNRDTFLPRRLGRSLNLRSTLGAESVFVAKLFATFCAKCHVHLLFIARITYLLNTRKTRQQGLACAALAICDCLSHSAPLERPAPKREVLADLCKLLKDAALDLEVVGGVFG